jgi:polysaccharide deacetylase family protein (PEP-CTERM system associated)
LLLINQFSRQSCAPGKESRLPQHSTAPRRRHLLTIALEDYFQIGAFNRIIQHGQWYRFEPRLERNTRRTLELLDATGQRATFFVLGWVGDMMPQLVAEVASRGHEIASKGYYHRSIKGMTREEFRDDLARAREALERAAGRKVVGYRVADGWFDPSDLWGLEVLAEAGYLYDSSLGPIGRRFAREPWRRFAHVHAAGERQLWEFPISSTSVLGWMIPIAGGNWIRQLPGPLVRRAVSRWDRTCAAPFVMYFHVWELDPDQPKVTAAPWLQRVRTYRHGYLTKYRFGSIAEHLGVETETVNRTATADTEVEAPTARSPTRRERRKVDRRPGLSVVIPCYNEVCSLAYLSNTLRSVRAVLEESHRVEFVFVDDRSTDDTWNELRRVFGRWDDCRFVLHETNRGVAGAIMTGVAAARNEVVASIDCDCSYDPHLLREMVPLLGPEVDLVTASPYHPRGQVRNVPEWRLFLSRTLSRLYPLVLHHRLATYTSCFRVYRRSRVIELPLRETGFLGVAELLGRVDLAGGRIVEFPTTLEVRVFGQSKMKILRVIVGHLLLLARFVGVRLTAPAPSPPTPPDSVARTAHG